MKNKIRAILVTMMFSAVAFALDFGINKVELKNVHNVAIVSVYSNAEIRKQDQRAGGLVGTIGFLKKKKDEAANPASAHFGGTELVDAALTAYQTELGKVTGWTIKSAGEVVASPAYKAFVAETEKNLGPKMVEANAKMKTTATGMTPTVIQNKKDAKKIKQLADLAKALGVDSVAIVDLDLSQRSTAVTAGVAGKVWPAAASTLWVVTQNEQVAVSSLGKVFEPAAAVEMKMDNITDSPESRSAFKEAIQKTADYWRDHLNESLK